MCRKRVNSEYWQRLFARLGSVVRFEPWRPYDRRFELAQVADVAVVTHRRGLETDLSLRTRLVDLMWLGLPSVVTAGGTMARVVAETGAGLVVPAGDVEAVAKAVADLLDDRRQEKEGLQRRPEVGGRTKVEHRCSAIVGVCCQPVARSSPRAVFRARAGFGRG